MLSKSAGITSCEVLIDPAQVPPWMTPWDAVCRQHQGFRQGPLPQRSNEINQPCFFRESIENLGPLVYSWPMFFPSSRRIMNLFYAISMQQVQWRSCEIGVDKLPILRCLIEKPGRAFIRLGSKKAVPWISGASWCIAHTWSLCVCARVNATFGYCWTRYDHFRLFVSPKFLVVSLVVHAPKLLSPSFSESDASMCN